MRIPAQSAIPDSLRLATFRGDAPQRIRQTIINGSVDTTFERLALAATFAAWKALLEDLPDRFVIGTDVDPATLTTYAEEIGYWRGILAQLSPATAMKLGHGNAERLLKLPSAGKR